jgi:hypothetical protein
VRPWFTGFTKILSTNQIRVLRSFELLRGKMLPIKYNFDVKILYLHIYACRDLQAKLN